MFEKLNIPNNRGAGDGEFDSTVSNPNTKCKHPKSNIQKLLCRKIGNRPADWRNPKKQERLLAGAPAGTAFGMELPVKLGHSSTPVEFLAGLLR